MVTKGIIRSIDFNGNTCVVRLPLFEPAGDSEPVEITAIISNTPGSYNGYLVDDVVLVAFEDGLVEQPVVIGKLYLGANIEKNTPRGVVNVTDSSASEKANIPFDTTLGSSLDEDMPNTQANYKTINEISNELNKTNSNLDNQVRDINNELVGKIDSEKNGTSFGWKVTDNSWSIFQTVNKGTDEEKTTNILYADKDGLKVTGDIEATTGHIGEFVIGQTHDCSEILDENNKPTKQSGIYSEGYINKFEAIPESKGVYVGTDGIKVGKSFSVDSNGHLTASSFSFEGLGKDSLTYSNINLQDGLKTGNGILMAFGEDYGEENSDSYPDGDYNYTSWWFQDSYILDLTSANSDDATIEDFINNTTGDSFAEDSDNSNYEEIREVNAFEKSTNTFRMPVRGWGLLQFPVCAQNLSSDSIHVLSFKFRIRPVDTNLFYSTDNYYDDWQPSRFVQLVNTLKFFGYVGRKKDAHRYDGRPSSYWEQTMWPISFEGNDKLISAVGDDDDAGYTINGDVLFDNEKTREGTGDINSAIRIENSWISTTSQGFYDVKIVSTKIMDPWMVQYYGNTDREIYYTPASKQFYAWGRVDQYDSLLNPDSNDISRLYFDWFRLNVDGPWVTVKFYFKTSKEIDENMCIQIGYINEKYDDEVRKFINDSLPEDEQIDSGDWNPEYIWDNEGLSIFEVKEVKIEHNEIATPFNYSLNDRTISSGHGLTAIINAQNKNDVYFEWFNKENSLTGFNSGIMVSDYPNSGELGSLIQIVGTSTDTQTNYIITVEVVGVTTELTDQGARDVYLVNTKSFMRSGAFTSTWLETSTPVHTGSNSSTPITITARSKTGTMLEANSSTSTIKYKWEGDSSYTTSSTNPLVINQLQNKNLIVVLYEGEDLIDTETITYSPLNTPIIDLTNDNATILYDNDTKLGSDVSTTAYLYLNGEVIPNTTYTFTANNCTITTSNNTVNVTALSANSATVTCTATVNNFNPAYNGKSYTKVFNITKQLKGAPGTNGQTISVENSFVYALGNNSSTAPNNNYSTWSSLILTPTSQNPYVWAVSKRETIVDGVSTITYGTTPFVYQTLEDFVSILSADGVDLIYKTTTGGKDAYHMRADNIVGSIGDKVNIGGVRTDNDTDTPTFDGGWTIKSETKDQQGHVTTPAAIYSNIDSMEDTTHHEGVYVGTDGIRLGDNFKVDKTGQVTATGLRVNLTDAQKAELKGDVVEELSTTIVTSYATSSDGQVVPSEWQASIPAVTQGQYLWIKRETIDSNNTVINTEYSVNYFGIDGQNGADGQDGQTGENAINYRISLSSAIHTGTRQAQDILVAAFKREGSQAEVADTDARFIINSTEVSSTSSSDSVYYSNGVLVIKASAITSLYNNSNIVIQVKHDTTIYDTETITYSPLNTPVLDLTNDSASITYNSNGTKIGTGIATSTAQVYLNGETVSATYNWRLYGNRQNWSLNFDGVTDTQIQEALANSNIVNLTHSSSGGSFRNNSNSVQLYPGDSFSFVVERGATVTVVSYGGSYGYLLINGESNNSESSWSKSFNSTTQVTISADSAHPSNCYLKTISITYGDITYDANFNGNSVIVNGLYENEEKFECVATNISGYSGLTLSKIFTVTKQIEGENGISYGNIYYRSNSSVAPATPTQGTSLPSSNWQLTPYTPDANYQYVYVSNYSLENGVYTFNSPVIYASYSGMISILESGGVNIISENANYDPTATSGPNSHKYFLKADVLQGAVSDIVTVGGFTVGSQALYKDIASFTDTSTQTGVYIGTNGIKLGQNFSVTDEGIVSATQFNYLETSGQNTYKNIQDGNNNCDDAYLIVGESSINNIYNGQYNWNDSAYQVQTATNSSGFNADEDRYEIQFNSSDYTPQRLYVNGEYTEVYPDAYLGLHSALVLPKVKLQHDTTYTLSFKFKFPGNETWMNSTKINRICAVVDTESNIKNLLRKFRNWYGAFGGSGASYDNRIFSSAYSILSKSDYDNISNDITNNWTNPTYTTNIISSSKGGSSASVEIDKRFPYTKSKYLSGWDGSTKYFAKSVKSTLISSLENTNIVRRCTYLRIAGAGHVWNGSTNNPASEAVQWGNYTAYHNGSSWANRKDAALSKFKWRAVENTRTISGDLRISSIADSEFEFSTTFKTGVSLDEASNLRTLILFELIDVDTSHRNSNQKYTLYVNDIQLEQGPKSNFNLSINDLVRENNIFAFKAGDGFGITPWGKIIAKNAEIHGDIKSGTIGGFTIGDQGLWKFSPINGETLSEDQVTSKFVKENLKLSTLNYYTGATDGTNIKAATFNGSYIGRRALYLGEATTAKIGDNYYSFGGDENWSKEQQYKKLNEIIQADTSSIKDASQTRQVLLTGNGLSMSQIAKQYEITAVYDHSDDSFGGYDARLVSTTNFGEVNFENEQDPCLTIRSYGDKMVEGQHFNHMIRLQAINSTTSGTSTWKNDTNIWISPLSFEVNLGDNQYDTCQEYGRCNRGFIILNAGRIEVGAGSNRRSYWQWDYSRNQNVSSPAQIYLGGYVYINGTQFGTSPSTTSSDINLKKDIEDLSSNYDVLFDNLKPVRFKYKDGNSSRFHTGLIAQDLQEAIKTAELTEKDVAAIVTVHDEDQKTHKKFEYLGIRYEELIALNIDQIQKLKKRVAELEEQLNKTEKSS